MQQLAKILIAIGIITIIIGVIMYLGGNKLNWLFRLPGDIRIEKENFRFYFPVTSMIIISIVLTLIIQLLKRFF
ncbi:MAG: DUF2905 family protein [Bacteroidetes bacterium]|jgi:hypothetical protein|nr:DUF2905 family protein [Bacteroidota bacterium]